MPGSTTSRNGGAEHYYIGSADWRPRNLRRRVEVVTPVTDDGRAGDARRDSDQGAHRARGVGAPRRRQRTPVGSRAEWPEKLLAAVAVKWPQNLNLPWAIPRHFPDHDQGHRCTAGIDRRGARPPRRAPSSSRSTAGSWRTSSTGSSSPPRSSSCCTCASRTARRSSSISSARCGEPIGVSLEPARIRRCANRCDFCFVDGLPDGLRDVLYIRDDDYRLSFRYGNFATLTNLKPQDVERIIEYRLSPLYVSVHATDPTVRRYLLRNPTAPEILPAAAALRRARHRVPHPDRDVARGERRRRCCGRRCGELYEFGPAILGLLGRAGRAHRVQQAPPGPRAHGGGVPGRDRAGRASDRRSRWRSAAATGPSAPTSCTSAPAWSCRRREIYDGFDQVENGVGAVRWLQRRIAGAADALTGWAGQRDRRGDRHRDGPAHAAWCSSRSPGPPARTFELLPVVNTLFGRVGDDGGAASGHRASARRSADRRDLDLALLPGESVNDDGLFIDSMSAGAARGDGADGDPALQGFRRRAATLPAAA